jgi:proteasome lid subunit RPN8/RPN11
VAGAERLVFPESLREEVISQAREGEPDEVCGILGGRGLSVERVFPVRNAADEVGADREVFRDQQTGVATGGRRPVHYYMDPRDQLRVYNELDSLGLEVVAYYHSHTHSEARPSPTDVRLASDLGTVYVLIGLEDSARPSVRAWRIRKADPAAIDGELEEIELGS